MSTLKPGQRDPGAPDISTSPMPMPEDLRTAALNYNAPRRVMDKRR
jgi:hypothetical protein